jgi:molybdopterin converting factor small subunit
VIKVTVKIDDGERKTEEKAARVGDLLDVLRKNDKRLTDLLVEGVAGRFFTVVKVNGQDARFLRNMDTPLKDGDCVEIIAMSRDRDRVLKEMYLTFTRDTLGQPILFNAGKMFGVVLNIKGASISTRRGFAHIEVEGPASEVVILIEWFKKNGVQLEEIPPKKKK